MAWTGSVGFVACLRRVPAALTVGWTLAIASGPLAAQTPEEVQELANQIIRRLDLQTQFVEPRPFFFALPGELLWVVIALLIVILLFVFRDLIPGLRPRQSSDWAAEEGQGATRAAAPAAVLGAADQLAAEGRFVEAMHVLLLQGLAAIRERLDEHFADSLTSREILRSTRLSESGRTSLRDIINRVELTYFGQRPAALPDYTACRASFNTLAEALHKSAAA